MQKSVDCDSGYNFEFDKKSPEVNYLSPGTYQTVGTEFYIAENIDSDTTSCERKF